IMQLEARSKEIESDKLRLEDTRNELEASLGRVHLEYRGELERTRAEAQRAQRAMDEGLKLADLSQSDMRDQLKIALQQVSQYSARSTAFALEKRIHREFIQKLCEEAEQAGTHHPLADFLAYTREQVLELELEMVDMPMGHPRRRSIEDSLKKLIQQRDKLERMVKETKSRFQNLSQNLRKTIGEA
ncbi:MAG: hypothetical protein EBT03_13405, partial [Betaproteobacteria bacterium]|nr:hypothetical protein [Betaproteobacteria bacterium]